MQASPSPPSSNNHTSTLPQHQTRVPSSKSASHQATPHFERVCNFCAPLLQRDEAICFHCAAGISRSATMLLAVLMRLQRMSLITAFSLLHAQRPVVWPNRSFMRQLVACVCLCTPLALASYLPLIIAAPLLWDFKNDAVVQV